MLASGASNPEKPAARRPVTRRCTCTQVQRGTYVLALLEVKTIAQAKVIPNTRARMPDYPGSNHRWPSLVMLPSALDKSPETDKVNTDL